MPEAPETPPRVVVLPPGAAGARLDRALADLFPHVSRTAVAAWIADGRVLVDGERLAGKTRVRGGERVAVDVPAPRPTDLVPEERALAILFEDDAILVLDKPAGWTVHPGSGRRDGTLANALVFHLRNLPTAFGADRPGIVHRLDKDTSGVLVVAKTEAAHRALARAFAAREVHKEYVAVVHGRVEGEAGVIELPLGRSSAGRTRMAVRESGGRAATTRWRVEERLPRHTVVRCFPVTGRTHQIRVHWRAREHPIVGDPLYGWRSSPGDDVPGRLMLHAHRISFTHPTSGEPVSFEAAVPAEFAAGIASLRTLSEAPPRRGRRRP